MSRSVERYRDPNMTWDYDSSGDSVTYPESFSVCTDCGVAVYDTEVHDKYHELLEKLAAL